MFISALNIPAFLGVYLTFTDCLCLGFSSNSDGSIYKSSFAKIIKSDLEPSFLNKIVLHLVWLRLTNPRLI